MDPRFAADVNGDGKADAVIFNHVQGIKVSLSDGSEFLPPESWSAHAAWRQPTQEEYPRFLEDVNADGMADAVLFHPVDGVLVGLSTGTSFADPVVWSTDGPWLHDSWDRHPRMLGDVDGDGAADAVLADPDVVVGLSSE